MLLPFHPSHISASLRYERNTPSTKLALGQRQESWNSEEGLVRLCSATLVIALELQCPREVDDVERALLSSNIEGCITGRPTDPH
jgi:hypothetical protein